MGAVAIPTKIKLEIASPTRLLFSEDVDEVTVPGSEGYLGILPGHLPLLSLLGIGVIQYRKGGEKSALAVAGGFVEVLPDRVIILADAVERPKEIDVERARRAKERAEKRLSSKDPVEIERALASLKRATTRIQIVEMRTSAPH